MTKEKKLDIKRILDFLLVDYAEEDQLRCDCPFCQKEKHLFMDEETSKYDCKSCGESGNIYTFLRGYHQVLLDMTEIEDYQEISGVKQGIGVITFNKSSIAKLTDDTWIIPSYNDKRNIITLRKWDGETNKVISCPTMKSGFFIARWDNDSDIVFICEGEWDALAWTRVLDKTKHGGSVISVPGASNFPEKYIGFFAGKQVILMYDNDSPRKVKSGKTTKEIIPGWNGMVLARKRMANSPAPPSSIQYNSWGDTPAPMDIRDYCTENFKRPRSAFDSIMSWIKPGTDLAPASPRQEETRTHTIKIPTVESFDRVVEEFRTVYEVNDTFEKCLATAFATCVSNLVDGEPLWMFLVGPPSSGKTTIIESFALSQEHSFHLSKLTSQAFVSGRAMGDTDPSILPNLLNKCLFVKDFTAILSLPTQTQEELFGILRDSYDGSLRVRYGNGVERIYDHLNFTIFAGCTDEIYTKNHSSLGERFLKIEIVDPSFSPAAQTRAALTGQRIKPNVLSIQTYVAGYLNHLFKSFDRPEDISDEIVDWLVSLSQIIAYLRTTVRRQEGHMSYRPRPEIPSRIAMQFKKLYQSLKIASPGKEESWYRDIVQKIATDSCVGWSLEFVREVLRRPDGVTTQEIASIVQVSVPHIRKVLQDMQELQVVTLGTRSNNSGRAGRSANVWFPHPTFSELWNNAGMEKGFHRKRYPSKKAKRNRVKK